MIRRIIIITLIIIGFYFVLVAILPEKQTIERSIDIDAPAWKIYHMIGDFQNWEQWNMDFYHDTTIVTELSENSTGVGAALYWESENGDFGKYEIDKCLHRQYVYYYSYYGENSDPLKGEFFIRKTADSYKLFWRLTCSLNTYNLFSYISFFVNNIIDTGMVEGLENIKYLSEKRTK